METSIYEEFNKSLYKNSGQSGTTSASNGTNVANDPSTLSSDNIIEFGQFRRLSINGVMLTVSKGDDIPKAIAKVSELGGGKVLLAVGTYLLNQDINIPSNVNLEGASRDNVILDCNSDYKVNISGSNAYTTGTVAINTGDTTVVGTGTTWTSAMVGRSIFLGKNGDFLWYPITGFTDTTHITIGSAYTGANLSGDTYTIATTVYNAGLTNLTIQNATGAGLKCQYVMEPFFDNIYVVGCGTGMDFDQVIFPLIFASINGNGVNWNANEVSGYEVRFSTFDDSTTGASVIFTSVGNSTFFDSSVRGNTGDGINMTSCEFNTFISVDISNNGGQGVELVSNCNYNQFTNVAMNSNTSEGLKLTATSDENIITGSQMRNNGTYGANIAASTCDANILVANVFENNSTAAYTDSGTSTIIKANSGATDNGSSGSSGVYSVGAQENSLVKTYFNYQPSLGLYTTSSADATVTTGGAAVNFTGTGADNITLTSPFRTDNTTLLNFSSTNIIIMDFWAKLPASGTGDVNMGFGSETGSFNGDWNDTSGNGASVKFAQKSTGELMAVIAEEAVGVSSSDISSGLTLTNWNNYRIELDLGTDAKFYVNGTLKATLSGANLEVDNTALLVGFGRSNTSLFLCTAPTFSMQMNP